MKTCAIQKKILAYIDRIVQQTKSIRCNIRNLNFFTSFLMSLLRYLTVFSIIRVSLLILYEYIISIGNYSNKVRCSYRASGKGKNF